MFYNTIQTDGSKGKSLKSGFRSGTTSERVYFPNLNAVRFFAASLVVAVHVEQARSMFGLQNIWKVPMFYALGDKGVTLFFVLSGFLITYLLIKEKNKNKTISIKDFYLRRILRIWPLYYLIVCLALFILPSFSFFNWPIWTESLHSNFNSKVLLFLLILPNVSQALYPSIAFGSQAWSVGVEEQFYLFWPWIIKYSGRLGTILLLIVIGMPLIVNFLYFISNNRIGQGNLLNVINFLKLYLSATRIDCMAMGGLAALILIRDKQSCLRVVFHPVVQLINTAVVIYILLTGFYVQYMSNIIHSAVFSILLINLAANPKRIFNLENKWADYLGTISYGIYMYHPVCIFLMLKFLQSVGLPLNEIAVWLLFYLLSFVSTILLASVSFKYFEKPLLLLKKRFTKVNSGKPLQ